MPRTAASGPGSVTAQLRPTTAAASAIAASALAPAATARTRDVSASATSPPQPQRAAHLVHRAHRDRARLLGAGVEDLPNAIGVRDQLGALLVVRREVLHHVLGEPTLAIDAADAGGRAALAHPREVALRRERLVDREDV